MDEKKKKLVSRREFLAGSGAIIAMGTLSACAPATTVTETTIKNVPGATVTNTSVQTVAQMTTLPPVTQTKTVTVTNTGTSTVTATKTATVTNTGTSTILPNFAASIGYLVYDSKLCIGCQSCMFACSLTHEGEANKSLSRIQIIRKAPGFTKYPYDITMAVCRQCATPVCVQNCPTGAARIDTANGNIRIIDESKCIGCGICLSACPQQPHRTVWNPVKKKASKCDLCANAQYWSEKGGPTGTQACVSVCPMKALKVVKEMPSQSDISGYDINLAPPPATTTTTAPPPTTTTTSK